MTTTAARLDRDAVVRTAADLADLQRQVAVLAIDELTEQVWRAALGRVEGEALRAVAAVYRDFGRDHPGRSDAIAHAGLDDEVADHGRRLAEAVRAVFRSFGLDDERAAVAHGVFSATVIGLVRTDRGYVTLEDAVALFEVGLASGEWP